MKIGKEIVVVALAVGLSVATAWAGGPGSSGGGVQGKKGTMPGPAAPGGKGGSPAKTEQSGDGVTRAAEPVAPAPGAPAARRAGDVEHVLTELQSLRDRRIISDDEYQRYRRQALDDFVRTGPAPGPR